MPLRRALLVCPLLLALGGAGCGGGDDGDGKQSSAPASTSPPPTTATAPASGGKAAPASGGQDLNAKPKVSQPAGPPPSKLVIKDLVKGSGRAAAAGDTLTVQYVGVNYKNGKQFDASWDRGQPFTFQLGAGMVIPGWDRGLKGMKVGGRRELIIPPDLAYGAQGAPPDIGPNSTLIFVVDLKQLG